MSRDKSDYVRFELRFEREFSDRIDAWIKNNKDGTPKAEILRQALEEFMQDENEKFPSELIKIIDQIRSRSPIPSRRNDIVREALKNYIKILDIT